MKEYKNRNWLYRKYITEELSQSKIAKICNTSSCTIFRWMKRHGIPGRAKSETLKGERSWKWKGGRVISTKGYIQIYKPDHPRANRQYVLEHRLVVEKRIGRYLYPWEVVHHINGIRSDNRDENLKLLPGNEHNTKIQEIYKENKELKYTIMVLLLLLNEKNPEEI